MSHIKIPVWHGDLVAAMVGMKLLIIYVKLVPICILLAYLFTLLTPLTMMEMHFLKYRRQSS
jgi:hypothetical protein